MTTQDAIAEAMHEHHESLAQPAHASAAGLGSATQFLRRLGACALIASGATFMWQGWGHLTTFQRYYSFLALVGSMAGAGVFCARRLGDDKGARTLLSLSTAALTVPMSQLGAMLFSALGGHASGMPAPLSFVATSLASVATAAALSAPLCVPVAYLGLAALARPLAGKLTLAALLLNAALLVPTRDADLMGLTLCAGFAGLFVFERRVLRPSARLANVDGAIVRAILAAPLLTLAVRSLLYPWSFALLGSICLSFGLSFFALIPPYAPRAWASRSRALGAALLLAAWVSFATRFTAAGWLEDEAFLVIALPLAPLAIVLSLFCERRGRAVRIAASYWAAGVSALQLFSAGSLVGSFACVLAGSGLVGIGYFRRERAPFVLGASLAVVGLGHYFANAIQLVTAAPWLSLAALGLAALVASSYVERNRSLLLERAARLRSAWRQWE